ncbi:MAG: T9SS type A sorting domain-containing protein [Saprospiraceae bacterium]|nr:T9SS type A sorting domain-containing protein [Saprospiraceae bacterium]
MKNNSTPSILTAQIKPNPAKDQITCTFPLEELSGQWQFVNFTGQVMQSGKWSASDILSIDVHILPAGIYALQWSGQSGEIHSSKVAITH